MLVVIDSLLCKIDPGVVLVVTDSMLHKIDHAVARELSTLC